MNENLQRALLSARQYWSALTARRKIALAVAVALSVAVLGVTTLVLKRDPYQTLYTDLQPDESKAVEKKLSEHGIAYSISEDRTEVSVPASLIGSARAQLAKDGVLNEDVVGFEKFDGSTLGMSSYVQRIQYIRAVQGELIRSIERLSAVKHARVHISIPPRKTFLEEEEPPKASVILELKPGQTPSKSEVRGIAHLVASAVEGLKVNQVTIVDTKGNLLQRPEDETMPGVSTALLEMERSIESEYEKRIEEILTPVVGLGNVRAKVTAEIDPSRINTTEETYDPDKATVRNKVSNDEVDQGARPNPIGIPGSRSNLPGTEVNNPPVPMSTNSSEKNMQNTSYAIPRKVQVTDKPSGSIKRLTVAVVVDGLYTKGTGAKATEVYSPRSDDEIKRLKDLVANAVGFDESRRDSVTISSLPFRMREMMPPEEEQAPRAWYQRPEFRPLIPYGAAFLGLLLFFLIVIRPLLRSALKSDRAQPQVQMLARTVAELEAAKKEEGLLALATSPSSPSGLLEDVEPLEKKEEEELKRRILDRLGQAPRKGTRIVQDWLEDESGSHTTEAVGA